MHQKSNTDETKRKIFFGFAPPDAFTDAFLTQRASIQNAYKDFDLRWIDPKNYHITLLYLGWVTTKQLNQYKADMLKLDPLPPIVFAPHCLSWMGNHSPRALTLEFLIAQSKGIETFQTKLAQDSSLDVDTYRPHITFGRHRGKVDEEKLQKLNAVARGVELSLPLLSTYELILYESVMHQGLVHYEKYASIPTQRS